MRVLLTAIGKAPKITGSQIKVKIIDLEDSRAILLLAMNLINFHDDLIKGKHPEGSNIPDHEGWSEVYSLVPTLLPAEIK